MRIETQVAGNISIKNAPLGFYLQRDGLRWEWKLKTPLVVYPQQYHFRSDKLTLRLCFTGCFC
jgi:hypothetical protein